jgi:hypothetical protein
MDRLIRAVDRLLQKTSSTQSLDVVQKSDVITWTDLIKRNAKHSSTDWSRVYGAAGSTLGSLWTLAKAASSARIENYPCGTEAGAGERAVRKYLWALIDVQLLQ